MRRIARVRDVTAAVWLPRSSRTQAEKGSAGLAPFKCYRRLLLAALQ
jgi:hypothetical protein